LNKVLDCTNIQTTYESLQSIIGVEMRNLVDFIKMNNNRFSFDSKYGYSIFDRPDIKTIKEYFKTNNFDYKSVIVHHASAILNDSSYLVQGIYNLKGLAETPKNTFKMFLKEFNIRFEVNAKGKPFFEYQGKEVSTDYIEHRFRQDQCINGFLFSYSLLEDTNISEIKQCPELIAHLGRHIGVDLRTEWIKKSTPSMVSFKVDLEKLHKSTFAGQDLNYQEKQDYFIKAAIDYLLIFDAIMYQYTKDNPMIFLNEDVQINRDDIVNIIPINQI
jgi:glutaredoxin-related protein